MVKTYKKAKQCFINCLNQIKREKNIYVLPFLEYLFDEIESDKKFYNIIFLCLKNLSNEDDIESVLDLIKENNSPMKIVLIHIKDENNINKIKDKISQEDSNLIYIEIETKNELEEKLLNCFKIIGKNISKCAEFTKNKNKETIISGIFYDDNNNDDEKNNDNENDETNNLNNQNNIIKNQNQNKRRILNNSYNEDKNENELNPYIKNNTIKESENESESTEKENTKTIINPYAKMKENKSVSKSNLKTNTDSYNHDQNSLFKTGSNSNA